MTIAEAIALPQAERIVRVPVGSRWRRGNVGIAGRVGEVVTVRSEAHYLAENERFCVKVEYPDGTRGWEAIVVLLAFYDALTE
jgi:hypothetical protein